jgi:predicted PurR-regulated permease PerM
MTDNNNKLSPRWHPPTKVLVAFLSFALLALFLYRFRSFIGTLVVSLIIYFLITPLVGAVVRQARLSWAAATNISFLFLLMVMVVVFTAVGLAVAQQFQALLDVTQSYFTDLPMQLESIIEQGVTVGPWFFDFSRFDTVTVFEQAAGIIDLAFSSASSVVFSVSSIALETVIGLIIALVISYFLTLDNARFRGAISNFVIPGYEYDIRRLGKELSRLWNSFLGGQLLVVTVTGVLTWVLISASGLRFSLGVGVLGGLGRFVPIFGPWVAGIVAAVVALVQPSNYLGLTPVAYALLVGLIILVINQLVDYVVIPRIMGSSLNISPAIVLIATLLGAILAGVLGLLLAAPVVASLALLGRYVMRKMIDQSPWEPPIDVVTEVRVPALARLLGRKPKGSAKSGAVEERLSGEDDID